MRKIYKLVLVIVLCQFSVASAQQLLTWTNVNNVTISGNDLEKVANIQTAWNAGAISNEHFYGNGWVEFRFTTNKYAVVGLAAYNTSTDQAATDYGIYAHINNYVYVHENGNRVSSGGNYVAVPYTVNDVFRVERQNGTVYYKKNGNIFYLSVNPSTGPLYVDCSFLQTRAATRITSYMGGIVWTGAQNQDWDTPGNWNLNRLPTTTDHVTINGCSICPKLTKSVTVAALQLNGGSSLDLDSHVVSSGEATTITSTVITSNGGKIQSKDFLEIKNSVFTGSVILEKTGGDSNFCYGGNTFSTEVKIVNTSNSSWTVAEQEGNQVKTY